MPKPISMLLKISSKIVFWLSLFLFIFIPLYPKFPLLNIPGTFVAIRLEDVLISLTILVWSLGFLSKKNGFLKDSLTQALMVFFFVSGLSLFSGIFLTKTVVFHIGLFHYLRRVELMLLMPIVATAVESTRKAKLFLISLLFTVFIVCLYALGQKYLDLPVISTTNSEFSKGLILHLTSGARVNSTFAGHYDLAIYLAMILSMLPAVLFYYRQKAAKIFIIFLFVLSFFVLILTAARLSFLAAGVGIVSCLIFIKKKMLIVLFLICSCLVLLYPSALRDRLVSTITINLEHGGARYSATNEEQEKRSQLNIPTLSIPKKLLEATKSSISTQSAIASDIVPGEPVNTTQLGVYRSFEIRLRLEWPSAIRSFIKNPFLGTGYSSLGLATDNDFLRSLGETGLLGTLSLALVIFAVVKKIWRGYLSNVKMIMFFSAATMSMLLAFLINGLFIDVFEASKTAAIFWMLLGVNIGMLKLNDD